MASATMIFAAFLILYWRDDNMIKINNMIKKYDNFTLESSLEIPEGQITGLVGRNGSGKTTAFKAILGLIDLDGGDIEVMGKSPKDLTLDDKQKIGVSLSDSGFSEYLTVNDIIPIMSSLYREFDRDYFLNQVARFRIPSDKKIKEFSTGMKAQLKMIIALSHKAKLLVLDEPTSGLDVVARDEILEMLRDFMASDETRSILISSHISSDLETLCDDIYMINEGKIVLHDDTDRMLSNYAVIKVDHLQYETLDKEHLLRVKKEDFGYSCLTDQKKFYVENYPKYVIENGHIDEIIAMMIKGEAL